MSEIGEKREVSISMRFRSGDLDIIDRGAQLTGVSRSEFVRRAAIQDAQLAVLNETVLRLSPEAFDQFMAAIDSPAAPTPRKMLERLSRKAPWGEKATQ